jgi:glycosyl transferase family 25
MLPQVLVINLASSTDRLAFQRRQLEKLSLPFERVEAVSVADMGEEECRRLSVAWERPLRCSEVACFLSHQRVWQLVLDRNKPALVLEDDAVLSCCVPALLEDLSDRKEIDLVTLEVRGRKKLVGKTGPALACDSTLLPLYQDRTGAAGYLLWPEGARKLLAEGERRGPALADALISTCYSLRAFQVEPAAIIQQDECSRHGLTCGQVTESTITPLSNPAPRASGFAAELAFKGRRIMGQVRIGLRYLSHMGRAARKDIPLRKADFSEGSE